MSILTQSKHPHVELMTLYNQNASESYAVQKNEPGKVRQIVNTDLATYVYYTWIYVIFMQKLKDRS